MIYHNRHVPDWETGGEKVSLRRKDHQERRSGYDRRVFSYTRHIPERRLGEDRRRAQQKKTRDVRPVVGAWGLQRPLNFKE